MEKITEFIGNNYAWFLTVTIILLFALIGYIYDSKRNKSDLMKKQEEELDASSYESIMTDVETLDSGDKSLSDMVSKSKNINPETKVVELNDNSILNENVPTNTEVIVETPVELRENINPNINNN